MANFTSITKEGSIIIMLTDERENPFKFDCAERKLYSFTGREVSTVNPLLRNCARNSNRGVSMLIDALLAYMNNGDYRFMSKMEMFIPHLDIIDCGNIYQLPDTLPKGYIKWVKENNIGISAVTLTQFHTHQTAKTMPKTAKEVYDIMRQRYSEDNHYIRDFLKLKEEEREIFCKVFKTSMKSFTWNFARDMENFLHNILNASPNYYSNFPKEWKEYVDTNRDFSHNNTTIQGMKDKVRNEKILSWESKFSAIETLSNDDFVVIVPKTMEEFTEEGRQQNNCVGSYYHDSMAENTQIIYFIRRKSNPSKSYITNRYGVASRETVETRMVNNTTNTDIVARELITRIDKMITDILKTL